MTGRRIILASYGTDFAETWGRKVRNTIIDNSNALEMTIAGDSSAAGHSSMRARTPSALIPRTSGTAQPFPEPRMRGWPTRTVTAPSHFCKAMA